MSIPRVLSIRKIGNSYSLLQAPVKEMDSLRGEKRSLTNIDFEGEQSLSNLGIEGSHLDVVASLEIGDAAECGLKFRVGDGEETVLGFDATANELYIDRTKSGEVDFHPAFAGKHIAPLKPRDGKIDLHIYVDASSIEVFANDGEVVLTERIFPDLKSVGVSVFSRGGRAKLANLSAWKVNSVWR